MKENIHIYHSKENLVIGFADWLVETIASVLQKQPFCTIALSGGTTPTDLFNQLASEKYIDKVDWTKLQIFWGDERDVPFDSDLNNANQAGIHLLNKVAIPTNQIHRIDTSLGADNAAIAYEKLLHQFFDGKDNSFDILMLGMGDDGHTLSLFPNTIALKETEKWVIAYYLEPQQMNRITLTTTVANKSQNICFLVSGNSKSEALREVIEGEYNPNKYPSQKIKLINGNLLWFVDETAASLIKK